MDKRRLTRILFAMLVLSIAAPAALADTIHLKNGRVIHTSKTEVIGDKVVFLVYGAKVAIPMARVERIEKNDATDATVETTVPPTPAAVGDSGSETENSRSGGSGDTDSDARSDDEDDEETPAEETREYWAGRVKDIDEERAALQEAIVTLRREERAFLFSRRSTAETRQKIEAAEARLEALDEAFTQLRREARRRGVPPGWLRVR